MLRAAASNSDYVPFPHPQQLFIVVPHPHKFFSFAKWPRR
jgi:hypothetical protein